MQICYNYFGLVGARLELEAAHEGQRRVLESAAVVFAVFKQSHLLGWPFHGGRCRQACAPKKKKKKKKK